MHFWKAQRLLEIAAGVALRAIHADVLSQQRKLRLRVVKVLVTLPERNLLPTARVVAGLATLREAAAVRILVAIRALIETEFPCIAACRLLHWCGTSRTVLARAARSADSASSSDRTDATLICLPVFEIVA